MKLGTFCINHTTENTAMSTTYIKPDQSATDNTPTLYIGVFDTGTGRSAVSGLLHPNFVAYVSSVPWGHDEWDNNVIEIPLTGHARTDKIAAEAKLNVVFNVLHAGGCTRIVREN